MCLHTTLFAATGHWLNHCGVHCTWLPVLFQSGSAGPASNSGVQAVGVLLMVLNAAWVSWMVSLIVKTALPNARHFVIGTFAKVKAVIARQMSSTQP